MLRDIALAFSLLSVVPTRAAAPVPGERVHAADYFSLVGALFGGVGAGVAWLSRGVGGVAESELVAFSLVVIWALLSRGLHWDGLADVADAWTVRGEDRLRVMKDSRTGAFGVLAIVAAFGIESMALAVVLSHGGSAALVVCGVVPVFGRLAASFGAWLGRPLSDEGLGASVVARPGSGIATSLVVTVCAMSAAAVGGPAAVVAVAAGLVAAPVVPHLIAVRFGGVNGDVLGASVIVTEVLTALAAAVTVVIA